MVWMQVSIDGNELNHLAISRGKMKDKEKLGDSESRTINLTNGNERAKNRRRTVYVKFQ